MEDKETRSRFAKKFDSEYEWRVLRENKEYMWQAIKDGRDCSFLFLPFKNATAREALAYRSACKFFTGGLFGAPAKQCTPLVTAEHLRAEIARIEAVGIIIRAETARINAAIAFEQAEIERLQRRNAVIAELRPPKLPRCHAPRRVPPPRTTAHSAQKFSLQTR